MTFTVTPDLRVRISCRLKADFENGRTYYPLDGDQLRVLPADSGDRPSKEYLEWHNECAFPR